MGLRCLLFSSDQRSTAPICQVLAGLGVEGESCADGPAAVEKVIQQSFQIVIIDWDMQPEAGLLLTTARERKAAERPLALAIVSDDVSVPKALQAGANSILRKPVLVNQVQDTLQTARDLLRARESAAQAAAASAASSARPACLEHEGASRMRAGEFLPSNVPAPGAQFVVESGMERSFQPAAEVGGVLEELEPTAAAVQPGLPPSPVRNEPHGLAWYLNQRPETSPVPQMSAAAAPAPARPELIGYDQIPPRAETPPANPAEEPAQGLAPESPAEQGIHEQKAEEQLFAYITGKYGGPEEKWRPYFRLGKKTVVAALVLAGCAIAVAPQAPWHPRMLELWSRGQRIVHAWLNPQPVTTPQAPASHEDFGRPGDEYKLPAAENMPDATTDPSQIRVVPVVDPTAKKPSTPEAGAEQAAGSTEGSGTDSSGQAQPAATQTPQNAPTQPAAESRPAASGTTAGAPVTPSTAAAAAAERLRSDTLAAASSPPASVAPGLAQPTPPVSPLPHSSSTPAASSGIPSSLKSNMASMTPEASGSKPVEAALPSIEPVEIPEATARGLLADHPAPAYPASAQGQEGTVVLQVQIGRDGTVQDAKFLQGSLAFARAAIEGAKQWKFKPYMMNGRPVSVQTNLTISFKPTS